MKNFKLPAVKLPTSVSRHVHKVGFAVRKASPEIALVAGCVGVGVSIVMACKATLKLNDILEEADNTIETIHKTSEDPKHEEDYTEEDAKKDITITYVQTGVKLAKLYGPSIAMAAASMASIILSHKIMRKRYAGLAAAYATVDRAFKEYRGRVKERFGEDVEKELRYNIKAKEFEKVTTDENGETTVEKEVVNVTGLEGISNYAKFFDEGSIEWQKDPEDNLTFLKLQEQYANDLLLSHGYLFLNDVYDMLGLPKTKAGQIVGWVYDKENPVGDNYVSFDIYNTHREANRNFVNGYEPVILLDFNVDGNILENFTGGWK